MPAKQSPKLIAKWLTGGAIVATLLTSTGRTQTTQPSTTPAASAASATVKQYCVGCHSAALKTGGIVLDPDLHQKAQYKIVVFATSIGHLVTGIEVCAKKGADGNQEFFACLQKRLV